MPTVIEPELTMEIQRLRTKKNQNWSPPLVEIYYESQSYVTPYADRMLKVTLLNRDEKNHKLTASKEVQFFDLIGEYEYQNEDIAHIHSIRKDFYNYHERFTTNGMVIEFCAYDLQNCHRKDTIWLKRKYNRYFKLNLRHINSN